MPIVWSTDIEPYPSGSSLFWLKFGPKQYADPFQEFRQKYHIVWNKKEHTVVMVSKAFMGLSEEELLNRIDPCLFCGHAEEHPCTREGCECKTLIKKEKK